MIVLLLMFACTSTEKEDTGWVVSEPSVEDSGSDTGEDSGED